MALKSYLMLAGSAFAGFRAIKYYINQKDFDEQVRLARIILLQQSPYYNSLSETGKPEFERRVVWFMQNKEFVYQLRGQAVTQEMKVLIAACAVQLTFGFKPLVLKHFTRVLIYPDKYLSTITRQYHEGEINLAGLVVLSWKHFQEGYANPTNGRNLGLHELAHALYFENFIDNTEYRFFKPEYLATWEAVTQHRLSNPPKSENPFFRRYGLTDKHEFFAVSVEHFFEQPRELQQHLPDVYKALSDLLHQNPLTLGQPDPA